MIKIVLIVAFVALAACQSPAVDSDRDARTLISSQDDSSLPEGNFAFGFETSNGIAQQAVGIVKNPEAAPEDRIQEVRGSYAYINNEGKPVQVNYIADENGYRVIPAAPVPVAPVVVKAATPVVILVIPAPVPRTRIVKVVKTAVPAVLPAAVNALPFQFQTPYAYQRFGYPYGLLGAGAYNQFNPYFSGYNQYNPFLNAPAQGYRVLNQNGQLVSAL